MAVADVHVATKQSKIMRASDMAHFSRRARKVPLGLREFVGKWCSHRAMEHAMVCVHESTIEGIAVFSCTGLS
jgi:hypothetical protein